VGIAGIYLNFAVLPHWRDSIKDAEQALHLHQTPIHRCFFIVQKHKKGLERVGIAGILFNICVLVCWN
jgi:hypothetical protein